MGVLHFVPLTSLTMVAAPRVVHGTVLWSTMVSLGHESNFGRGAGLEDMTFRDSMLAPAQVSTTEPNAQSSVRSITTKNHKQAFES